MDGKPITYGDVEKEQGGKLVQAEIKALTELHDIRRNAVEQYVTKRLLEDEAKAKGETLDQWYEKELLASVPGPSDEEMKKFYEQNKSQMGGQTYEQIKDRIGGFFGVIITRREIEIDASALEHEMIYSRRFPAGLVQRFGDGFSFVGARMLDDFVLLFHILGITGDAGRPWIRPGHQRGHVGSSDRRKHIPGMADPHSLGD